MRQHQRSIFLAVIASAIAVSTGHAQTKLQYQFKEGDKVDYVIETKMKMMISRMGKEEESTMTRTLGTAWSVLKVDSQGQATVQIKVSSAKVVIEGPMGKVEVNSQDKTEPTEQFARAVALSAKATAALDVTGTMLPTGEMKDVKVSEETISTLKKLLGPEKLLEGLNPDNFKNLITTVVFPKEEITTGKTWTNKIESKLALHKIIADNTYTYEGQADKDGAKLEKITVKPAVKIEPDPNVSIKFEVKDVKGSGVIFFDNKKGRLVESVINQRIDLSFNANGEMGRQVQDQMVTIRVKKQ